jgi:hypothetical protein
MSSRSLWEGGFILPIVFKKNMDDGDRSWRQWGILNKMMYRSKARIDWIGPHSSTGGHIVNRGTHSQQFGPGLSSLLARIAPARTGITIKHMYCHGFLAKHLCTTAMAVLCTVNAWLPLLAALLHNPPVPVPSHKPMRLHNLCALLPPLPATSVINDGPRSPSVPPPATGRPRSPP